MLFSKDSKEQIEEQLYVVAARQYERQILQLTQEKKALENALQLDQKQNQIGAVVSSHISSYQHAINMRIQEYASDIERLQQSRDTLMYEGKPVDAKKMVQLNDQFVTEFAKKFHDIDDLATTFSDAPEELEHLLPRFYATLLAQLDKKEQERQMARLAKKSPEQIKQILEQTIKMYNDPSTDQKVKLQCKQLVHMTLFEMIQKEANAVTIHQSKGKPHDTERKNFFNKINALFEDVGGSDILDDFSEYENTEERTIGNVLFTLKQKLIDNVNNDYSETTQKESDFLHKIRIGRADLRDHSERYKKNVGRDIFFARNIRDIELFTKGNSDQMFHDLEITRALVKKHPKKENFTYGAFDDSKEIASKNAAQQQEKSRIQQEIEKEKLSLQEAKATLEANKEKAKAGIEAQRLIVDKAKENLSLMIQKVNSTLQGFKGINSFINPAFKRVDPKIILFNDSETTETLKQKIDKINGSQRELSTRNKESIEPLTSLITQLKDIHANLSETTVELAKKETTFSSMEKNLENRETALALLQKKALSLQSERPTSETSNYQTLIKLRHFTEMLGAYKADKKESATLDSFRANSTHRTTVTEEGRQAFIQQFLTNYNQQFTIEESKGKIKMIFSYANTGNPSLAQAIATSIGQKGGFGSEPDNLVSELGKLEPFNNQIITEEITGDSLSEIKAKIAAKLASARESGDALAIKAYTHFQNIHETANKTKSISELGLSTSDELLLRKLLELRIYYAQNPTDSGALSSALALINENNYKDALKRHGIENAVDNAYLKLNTIDENTVSDTLKPLIQKAKVIVGSNNARAKRLADYQAIWTSNLTNAKKIDRITEIFAAEYREVGRALGLSAPQIEDLIKNDIHNMAQDLVRLTDRVEKGLPILTKDEQINYFKAINAIKTELANRSPKRTLSDVSFKVKHSSSGLQEIELTDNAGNKLAPISLVLTEALPYSLNKPPGDCECIFSFGGSRGNVAPTEGIASVYGRIKRYFTAARELGEGQYGAVKLASGLLSHANYAIKKGVLEEAYVEAARQDLRTRAITSRPDQLASSEAEAMQRYQDVQNANAQDGSMGITYIERKGKERTVGAIHAVNAAKEYLIISQVASGETGAEMTLEETRQFSKGDKACHDPVTRIHRQNEEAESEASEKRLTIAGALTEKLAIAGALVETALRFEQHFSHNDIKPENFLLKQRSDGSYKISYIDWATQGSKQVYQGTEKDPKAIFKEMFPKATTDIKETAGRIENQKGQFVETLPNGSVVFGVKPRLQVLHGARNCTIPYICPALVWKEDTSWQSKSAGITDTTLDTIIDGNDPQMDNWALTATMFGICNREAYFALAQGRVTNDYLVPGVLGRGSQGNLVIENTEKFDDFFACESSDKVHDKEPSARQKNHNAVMYIPTNTREGAPFPLYRLLKEVKDECLQSQDASKLLIGQEMDAILKEAHQSIASGHGLTKKRLLELKKCIENCQYRLDKLSDATYQASLKQAQEFEKTLEICKEMPVNDLLQTGPSEKTYLQILCTYPNGVDDQKRSIKILEKAFTEDLLHNLFLSNKDAPGRNLFQQCITGGQSLILKCLLEKVGPLSKDAFKELVAEQGLLHYAMQERLTAEGTEVAQLIVQALERAGVSKSEIFELMLRKYQPSPDEASVPEGLQWSTNAFQFAIRNNSPEQLKLVLDTLPEGSQYDNELHQALHLAANLLHPELFHQILEKKSFTVAEILKMTFPPGNTSPYHLFLHSEETTKELAVFNTEKTLAKDFLLNAPTGTKDYPCLIATAKGNIEGIKTLLQLAQEVPLTPAEMQTLLTQTDAKGKNILNHLLEYQQIDYLTEFLQQVKLMCPDNNREVMKQLLSNIHPTDPLRNYLATSSHDDTKFQVMGQLLDSVCYHSSRPQTQPLPVNQQRPSIQQEHTRLVSLLSNQDWLINQARSVSDLKNIGPLRTLLRDESLTNPTQQILLKILMDNCPNDSTEKRVFGQLFNEVMPKAKEAIEQQTALIESQIPEVLKEVAIQRNDLLSLLEQMRTLEEKKQRESSTKRVESEQQTDAEPKPVVTSTKTETKAGLTTMENSVSTASFSDGNLTDTASESMDSETQTAPPSPPQQEIEKEKLLQEELLIAQEETRKEREARIKAEAELLQLRQQNIPAQLTTSHAQQTTEPQTAQDSLITIEFLTKQAKEANQRAEAAEAELFNIKQQYDEILLTTTSKQQTDIATETVSETNTNTPTAPPVQITPSVRSEGIQTQPDEQAGLAQQKVAKLQMRVLEAKEQVGVAKDEAEALQESLKKEKEARIHAETARQSTTATETNTDTNPQDEALTAQIKELQQQLTDAKRDAKNAQIGIQREQAEKQEAIQRAKEVEKLLEQQKIAAKAAAPSTAIKSAQTDEIATPANPAPTNTQEAGVNTNAPTKITSRSIQTETNQSTQSLIKQAEANEANARADLQKEKAARAKAEQLLKETEEKLLRLKQQQATPQKTPEKTDANTNAAAPTTEAQSSQKNMKTAESQTDKSADEQFSKIETQTPPDASTNSNLSAPIDALITTCNILKNKLGNRKISLRANDEKIKALESISSALGLFRSKVPQQKETLQEIYQRLVLVACSERGLIRNTAGKYSSTTTSANALAEQLAANLALRTALNITEKTKDDIQKGFETIINDSKDICSKFKTLKEQFSKLGGNAIEHAPPKLTQ